MIRGYYFITDHELSRAGVFADVTAAVAAGVSVIQYRNKNASSRAMLREALELRRVCPDALFLVNDRVDIALAAGAHGVHLGQADLPYEDARKLLGKNRVIGLTVHSLAEALAAEEAGADYIGVAPIFATSTKADAGTPLGIEGLKAVCDAVSIPVAAIGGITLTNAGEVVRAGADALCAISAVIANRDALGEIRKFQALYA